MTSQRAVFLDRDGTINVKAPEGDYITTADAVVLLPGAAQAIRRLNDASILAIVVTNQRGISRGQMSTADLDAVHARLADLLADSGAHLDATYVCPHGHGECSCRKPLPGLILDALRDDPRIDVASSWLIGDAESDVAAGAAAGLRTIRLADASVETGATEVAPDLDAAVRTHVLAH